MESVLHNVNTGWVLDVLYISVGATLNYALNTTSLAEGWCK